MRTVVLHPAQVEHLSYIRRFHAEQNQRDGTSYPLPRFFDAKGNPAEQVPVSLVGIPEGKTEPVQAIWIERRAELMFAGCDPRATAFARRDMDGLVHILRWFRYQGLHCEVPIALADAIARPLFKSGFERTDKRLAHFFREI